MSPVPCVTLIMTVRDGEDYLADALQSAVHQAFADWDLILWDDGSTEQSASIGQPFADRDARIRMIRSPSMGRCRALTEAHEKARGEFVGWVDAGDRLAAPALERVLGVFVEDSECGMVYSNHTVRNADGVVEGVGYRSRIPYRAHRLLSDFAIFHFHLLRRSVFESAGGINPDLQIAIDYELCLRVSKPDVVTTASRTGRRLGHRDSLRNRKTRTFRDR